MLLSLSKNDNTGKIESKLISINKPLTKFTLATLLLGQAFKIQAA